MFCSTFLLPLTVAAVSVFATISINKQQVASAKQLANGQQENAQKIADANIKNSKTIAEGEMETAHLKHLVVIFSSIISPEESATPAIIQQRIRSLAVYGDEALPFLLQIRQHFSKLDKTNLEKKGSAFVIDMKEEALVATTTIGTIIKYSQLNIPKQEIKGKSDKERHNLRNKEYINYNLAYSKFKNVNLYRANFSSSSLQHSYFTNVDLVEANFQNANLTNVTFDNVKLRKTDFHQANLKKVIFSKCQNIEDAKFSLYTVLEAESGFFGKLEEEQYILLLMAHEEELVRISNSEEEKSKLDNILTILQKYQITSFHELQKKFQEHKSKRFTSIKVKTDEVDQMSMNFINKFFE